VFLLSPATTLEQGVLCIARAQQQVSLTENYTPQSALRIRLKSLPEPGEFDEFDLSHFRAGGVFLVPSYLASVLIISGYAELVDDHPGRAEAADFGVPRFPKRR
jgi:hypothetical protein